MSNPMEYPYEEGDVIVLGPQIFATADGSVVNWKGENFVPQSERYAKLEKILDAIGAEGGSLVIRCDLNIDDERDWSLMSMFGSEAEDSPMAGGSHIGAGDTLDECLETAVK